MAHGTLGALCGWYVRIGAVFIIDNGGKTIVALNIDIYNALPPEYRLQFSSLMAKVQWDREDEAQNKP